MKVILRHPERREVAVEGRRRVGDLLRELGLQPEAYLVIRDNHLLTRDAQLEDADTVEVRPVISGGARDAREGLLMRCTKCRQDACLELRRHNAAFCEACFTGFFRDQIVRAIEHEKMFRREEPVLVAVSGGKDSLALWDALLEMGYETTGLYIGLGIPGYSEPSRAMCEQFAAAHDAKLLIVDLETEYGLGISETAQRTRRPACSACGLSKRYLFNKVA